MYNGVLAVFASPDGVLVDCEEGGRPVRLVCSGTNPEPSESARYSLPSAVTVSGRTMIVALFLMTVLLKLAPDGMGPLRTPTPTATAQRYVVVAVGPEISASSCVWGDMCHTIGSGRGGDRIMSPGIMRR